LRPRDETINAFEVTASSGQRFGPRDERKKTSLFNVLANR